MINSCGMVVFYGGFSWKNTFFNNVFLRLLLISASLGRIYGFGGMSRKFLHRLVLRSVNSRRGVSA
jgi:hypothetical protein